ncbi:MAG: hypothetical protein LBT34_04180 [Clostridiales Family XIII bacterium]|jgi:hypothetical protein|nr:hypothetical protein [Clostridiales Family XIII bacterium]
MTFKERADAFWRWFGLNEKRLSDMFAYPEQYESGDVASFISNGVRLISDDVRFRAGGGFEFIFSPGGEEYLFYLFPYLIARMPRRHQRKWKFFPFTPGSGGRNFDLEICGKAAGMDEIAVKADYDVEKDCFSVDFYHKAWNGSEKNDACGAFRAIADIAVGEGFAEVYIDEVKPAAARSEGMFPLTELERRMRRVITASGREIVSRPDRRYGAYTFTPRKKDALRYDVFTGVTGYMALINEYYEASAESADKLKRCGAEALFLLFPYDSAEKDPANLLELRREIESKLRFEVLGEQDSGEEIGIVLGGAMGGTCVYIDLLLYDAARFEDKLRVLLSAYPYKFYLSEFRQKSRLRLV